MTPRRLTISSEAVADLRRRSVYLAAQRGPDFARKRGQEFIAWLCNLAEGGAQIGTEHPRRPGVRTFSYRHEATVLASYSDGEVAVIRIYFAGQDWSG